jgi:hypothetical protein
MNFYYLLVLLMSLGQTQVPSGAYCGTKTVFGESITGLVTFKSPSVLDFAITGDFNIDCIDESYSVSGNQILFTDINKPGDCTHDALSENQITLNSVTYDTTKNTIDVSVKYSIAKIDILLNQC